MRRKLWLYGLMGLILAVIGSSFFGPDMTVNLTQQDRLDQDLQTVDPAMAMVAITFDDGPHETVTAEILDVLERYQAHATFFVLGGRVSHHASLIQRMVKLGCELGNHTYGHQDLSQMSKTEMLDQLQSSISELALIVETDALPKIVRPPFGNVDDQLRQTCPYPMITWSIDTLDWSHQNVDRTVHEVISQVQDGDIILMHDMYEATAEATEKLVVLLQEQGYQLVTVSEMFAAKGIPLEAGKVYRHAH